MEAGLGRWEVAEVVVEGVALGRQEVREVGGVRVWWHWWRDGWELQGRRKGCGW